MYVPADRKRRAVSSILPPGCDVEALADVRDELGLTPRLLAIASSRALFITILAASEDIGLLKLKPIRLSRHCARAGVNERHNQAVVSDREMLHRESVIRLYLSFERWTGHLKSAPPSDKHTSYRSAPLIKITVPEPSSFPCTVASNVIFCSLRNWANWRLSLKKQ